MAFAVPAARRRLSLGGGRPGRFATVMSCFDPTVLIGLSTAAGAFTEPLVRGMASGCAGPIILPLSNPSSDPRPSPTDLLGLDRRAGAGGYRISVPVGATPDGRSRSRSATTRSADLPGHGPRRSRRNATRVTDAMFLSAPRVVATCSPAEVFRAGCSTVTEVPQVADTVALAVAVQAVADGVAPRRSESELADRITRVRWHPRYRDPM